MTRSAMLLTLLMGVGAAGFTAAPASAGTRARVPTVASADHVAHARSTSRHHHRHAARPTGVASHTQLAAATRAGSPRPARPARAPRHGHSTIPARAAGHAPSRGGHAPWAIAASADFAPATAWSPATLDETPRIADRWMTPRSGRGPPSPTCSDALPPHRADLRVLQAAARTTFESITTSDAASSARRFDRARFDVPRSASWQHPEPIPGSPAHRPEGAVACIVMPSVRGVLS